MATEEIVSGVGVVYKRLLSHRPVVQNQVHYFVKEFEGKRGNRDLQLLQDCFRKANEMEAVFIPEISSTNSHFATIRQKTDEVTRLCGEILSGERDDLGVPVEEVSLLEEKVQVYKAHLQQDQTLFGEKCQEEMAQLKDLVARERATRSRLRSTVSLGSSVTVPSPVHGTEALSSSSDEGN